MSQADDLFQDLFDLSQRQSLKVTLSTTDGAIGEIEWWCSIEFSANATGGLCKSVESDPHETPAGAVTEAINRLKEKNTCDMVGWVL